MVETLNENDNHPETLKEKAKPETPHISSPIAAPKKQKMEGLVENIKRKLAVFTSKPAKNNKLLHYEENIATKTAYSFHLILTLSGKITRQLMESYKNFFDFPEQESGNIYANLGLDFLTKEDYKQAVAAFKKSLELHPKNTEVFYYLGNAFFKEKDYKEAIGAYLNAVKADPKNANVLFELGLSYAALEKYAEAVKSYEKAIELDPENSEIYYCLGISYDQTKDYQPAIEKFKKAIELNPRLSRYYHSLGFTYECIKQHDEAIQCFKKAVELETG